MGDRLWLGLGGRARTPQPSQQPPHPEDNDDDDRTSATRARDLNTQRTLQRSHTEVPLHKNPHKAPRLSRFSSLMGLNGIARAHSPTATSFEIAPNYPEISHQRHESMQVRSVSYHEAAHDPSTGIWRRNPDPETEFRYRESDATWHNPSLQQMIETVLCTIMTNGISAPIPSHLNSFIAGMIEEFSIHISETKTLQKKVADLEKTRAEESRELLETTNEWQERERQFKLEIKRLEHIISDTQKGAESVVVVRAGSVCNRNDGRAFRAKLNRLSRSDEDEDEGRVSSTNNDAAPNLRDTLVQSQLQDEVNPKEDSETSSSPGKVPSDDDHANLVKQLTGAAPHSPDPEIGNTSRDPAQLIVARDAGAPIQSNRKSNSTRGSSASGIASSTSSGLVMGEGILVGALRPDHITPGTTPPCVPPAKARAGTAHVKKLRELVHANGGVSEDAIADESSYYTPPIAPPHHLRAYSFDAGDDAANKNDNDITVGPTPSRAAVEGVRRPLKEGPQATDTRVVTKDGHNRRSSKVTPKTQAQDLKNPEGSTSSPASRSPTLLFMGRNHVGRVNSNPGDGRGVFIPGYSSPTRKSESGQDPFPSQETIQIARQQRTTHNTQANGRAFLSDEELAITNKEILTSIEQTPLNLTPTRADANLRLLSTNIQASRGVLGVRTEGDPTNQLRQQD